MARILYEDNDVIVVHKESGVSVQTSKLGQKDMVSLLKNYRAEKNEEPYIGVVHRLDQPVEGVMVFAKTKEAAANLSAQVAKHSAQKYYRAVVFVQENHKENFAEGSEGTLTDYLLRDGKTNTSSVVKKETAGAKKAVLSYKVLRRSGSLAEVEVKLETGRHHQIRVQMANAGCPLVGDRKYGVAAEQVTGAGRNTALCAVKLRFIHPKTKKDMEFTTEPQNETFRLLEKK